MLFGGVLLTAAYPRTTQDRAEVRLSNNRRPCLGYKVAGDQGSGECNDNERVESS